MHDTQPSLRHWLRSFLPSPNPVNYSERIRACLGALFGIGLTSLLSYWMAGAHLGSLWLIAPMGASAVLLFAVPASPLAQPWSIIGGNVTAALIGISCAKLVTEPTLAATLAISFSIFAMFLLRCIHPPSGAVALTTVLGGPTVHAMGYAFAFMPVLLNSSLLMLCALIFNNLTGRRYPHPQFIEHPNTHATQDPVPMARLGFTPEDLEAALKKYNQVLDISRDDLEDILLQTEISARRRHAGNIICADIMSKDVITINESSNFMSAWQLMQAHRLNDLLVVDENKKILGIVDADNLLAFATNADTPLLSQTKLVQEIMTTQVPTATANQSIVELVPLMSNLGMHQVPIVNETKHLVGVVAQSDLIAALFEILDGSH